jgi:AcrR family transcriptional regulator
MIKSYREKEMPKVIEDMQIFQAVIKTIAERGYAGATTRQIAVTAGVSEVTLFRKYGSKGDLIRQTIAALVEKTGFQAATVYTGDLHADLRRVLQAYQASVVLYEHFFIAIFADVNHSPELANSFSPALGLFHAIGELLGRYQAEGVLRIENVYHSVASLLGPLIYSSMITRTAGKDFIPAIDIDSHIRYFLEGRCRSTEKHKD